MKTRPIALALLGTLATLAPPADAGGREPGSLLVFPLYETGNGTETILSITNTNENVYDGRIQVKLEIVAPTGSPKGAACIVNNHTFTLESADTLSIPVACLFTGGDEGYVVAHAVRYNSVVPVSHDYLVGSALALSGKGSLYSYEALSFTSPLPDDRPTDLDGDGDRDFDGLEYELAPDTLIADSFLAGSGTRLAMLSLPGQQTTRIRMLAYNDDGVALSATYELRCFDNPTLEDITLALSESFLKSNLPNDPSELDLDCDGDDDRETGWFRIEGLSATTKKGTVQDPVILGVLTQSKYGRGSAKTLWQRGTRPGGEL